MFPARPLSVALGLPMAPLLAGLSLALACSGTHHDAPAPTITRFEASPSEVEVGEKATLTAVFANGQGVLDPNLGPIDSGSSVTVDPLKGGTYTLTVTGVKGAKTTSKATVHVKPGLLVEVEGLPGSENPEVKVKGNGQTWTLMGTQAIKGLAPGVYTVEARDVTPRGGAMTYHPHRPTQEVVIGEAGARVKVFYPEPTLKVPINDKVAMDFVLIPAGTFTMGASSEDGKSYNFQPAHTVTLGSAFYLATNLTTQAQWEAVMHKLPSMPKSPRWKVDPAMPVSTISWIDIHDRFLPSLAALVPGQSFRLPTEAEWEYAVRAGSTTRYPWGTSFANAESHVTFLPGGGNTQPTPPMPGIKPPNPWGLYDMQGLLMQWVEDTYQPSYSGAPTDGKAWIVPGPDQDRCVRGSTFDTVLMDGLNPVDDYWASAFRFSQGRGCNHPDFGVRLALDIPDNSAN